MNRLFPLLFPAFSLFFLGFYTIGLTNNWDQKTHFSINQPVSIAGHVVLPAGSYVIKRLEAVTPVVEILNESETKVYLTVMPVSDYVANPPDKPTFAFQEMPEGPPALKSWFYPGQTTGYEFVTGK